MTRVASCGVLVVATCLAPQARAFSGADAFAQDPVSSGGGGGRYFTGSPVDGYGCDVCHRGGVEPQLSVFGLPLDGYVPGNAYEVQIVWPSGVPHALHLEVVGRDGLAAGEIVLPEEAQVEASGRCGGDPARSPAAYERRPPGRHVLGVEDCGASSLRFYFTAPDTPDVAFALSAVAPDDNESTDGDGTLSVQRVLQRVGEPAAGSGCTVEPQDQRPGAGWIISVLAGLGLLWRGRRRDVRQATGT